MPLVIELTPAEQARLTAVAQQEGLPPEEWVRKVVTERLPWTLEEPTHPATIDLSAAPFRQDPRLIGIRFLEDPMAPLDPEDWPEAFD
jgi:hypothetical protein